MTRHRCRSATGIEHARLLFVARTAPVSGRQDPKGREAEHPPDRVLLDPDRLDPRDRNHGSARLEEPSGDDQPVALAQGREVPIDEDRAHERDQDRSQQQGPGDHDEGLEIRSIGSREPIHRLHERALRQELDHPSRHHRDHGDTPTGRAGEQQIGRTHPYERRLREIDGILRVIRHEDGAELRRLLRRQGDQRCLGSPAADDLDPQLHHPEDAMRELLHHVHALDASGLQGSLPALEETTSNEEIRSLEPVPEARPTDRGAEQHERTDDRREQERPLLTPEQEDRHQRQCETADRACDPDGDRGGMEPPPRRERGRPRSFDFR